MKDYEKVKNCLLCDGKLISVYNFGQTALANDFSEYSDYIEDDKFDLHLHRCKDCNNVQLDTIVNQDRLFRDYLYVSGTTEKNRQYFKDYAISVKDKFNLVEGDLILDIGSNDGVALKSFKDLGMEILGVDPARNIADQANKNGIPTIPEFFNKDIINNKAIYKKPKIISCNNCFAHTKDLGTIVEGVIELLDDNGVFIFENSYLLDILDNNYFDTIYHEHIYSHSLKPLAKFFRKYGMKIFNVERTRNQGGSIRVFCCKNSAQYKIEKSVFDLMEAEKNILHKLDKMVDKIKKFRKEANMIFKRYQDRKIAIYGMPAKTTTLLSILNVDRYTFSCAYEDAELKIGKYSPGLHIPIKSSKDLLKDNPQIVFIGAWNFAESIIEKWIKAGYKGIFIIPLPKLKIIKAG